MITRSLASVLSSCTRGTRAAATTSFVFNNISSTLRQGRVAGRATARASFASASDTMKVFDRALKIKHKQRVVLLSDRDPTSQYDYLRDEIADRLTDRIMDITKKFPVMVDLGAGSGHIRKVLADRGAVNKLIQIEPCEELLNRDNHLPSKDREGLIVENMIVDEEDFDLPDQSVDIVISNLSLHWVNDLPRVFEKVKRVLKPDGVFLGAMLGGDTLQELRSAFALADMERLGGLSPHTSPFAYIADVGNLLTRAGFALPTVDTEKITIKYPEAFTLMEHLKGMGESNADLSRQLHVSRDVFLAAASAYDALYKDEEGNIDATFQILYFIGWSPHSSQPKPLNRGSATFSLTDIDKLDLSPPSSTDQTCSTSASSPSNATSNDDASCGKSSCGCKDTKDV